MKYANHNFAGCKMDNQRCFVNLGNNLGELGDNLGDFENNFGNFGNSLGDFGNEIAVGIHNWDRNTKAILGILEQLQESRLLFLTS